MHFNNIKQPGHEKLNLRQTYTYYCSYYLLLFMSGVTSWCDSSLQQRSRVTGNPSFDLADQGLPPDGLPRQKDKHVCRSKVTGWPKTILV